MILSFSTRSAFALFAACFVAGAAPAGSAQTHEGVTLGPVPDWVVAVSAGESNSNDLGGAGDGVEHLLADDQVRVGAGPEERFSRRIFRVRDERGARDSAEFNVEFDPSFEKVVLHRATIHRGGREIDRLSDAGIHLLQRESGLEAHLYDQRITAVLFLEDVRWARIPSSAVF
jgi:hypothetical protein